MHLRARTCEVLPLREWEGISEAQKRQLERRISTKKTREENWYIIYEILFPGAERPKSPCMSYELKSQFFEMSSDPAL